ncbi:hypothetical protein PQH03_29050 [Ralstonia insidiosa]|jgi:hypothetical protein|uniref:Uncharacterized protein n=1 Tax=Ralstonia insidiosa TaxID=190721 RepID=A0A192A7V0_9RALS|nr:MULTISPECIES: hypothetical protein [Ralstonia]KMW47663.1 hypothetical protein AC240_08990 [Ralstonia sp. MD27]ANJ76413.1 hypothetical protein A9Y76_27845 [Ralstonia insidiosa]MBA9869737.1 hypothetical protein [Ralstonia insidiosa]MBA9885020.1 hypothetical protein [Ralstonia pickettii]MBA9894758.1 hypothetical protein [Ralstonia pickettii]
MNEIIKQYFQFVLASLGYPIDDILWSLSHCQGDGMRFTGKIADRVVAKRLLRDRPVFLGLALSAIDKGETISISALRSSNYVHENSMEADRSFDTELTLAEDKAMSLLLSSVKEDIVNVSMDLRNKGYAILESSPYGAEVLVRREIGDITAKVIVDRDEFFPAPESGEALFDVIDLFEFANGRSSAVAVSVVIEHAGIEVGSAHCGGHSSSGRWEDLVGQTDFQGLSRGLLADACAEARQRLGATKVARGSA